MKFKRLFDFKERKRRVIARRALEQTRRLAATKYPLAMLFDRGPNIGRRPGESWPQAFARPLGLSLEQLRDHLAGSIATGFCEPIKLDVKNPSDEDLLNYFSGLAALMIETERELANAGSHPVL